MHLLVVHRHSGTYQRDQDLNLDSLMEIIEQECIKFIISLFESRNMQIIRIHIQI